MDMPSIPRNEKTAKYTRTYRDTPYRHWIPEFEKDPGIKCQNCIILPKTLQNRDMFLLQYRLYRIKKSRFNSHISIQLCIVSGICICLNC